MNAAPLELAQIGLDPDAFKRADSHSWRGPCPRCQGTRRFLIFTDKDWPHWNFRCDSCGLAGWPDELNARLREPVPDELRRQWAEQRKAEEAERARIRTERLAEFSSAELWEELHHRLTAEHREWWRDQGVPDEWQDHLRLGFTPDKVYRTDEGLLHSAAYTIPYFHSGYAFVTMQYRLHNPANPNDRYRFEYGLGTSYFMAEPAQPIGDQVIICEGAKKAMVTHIYGNTRATVLGVPSKSDFAGVNEAVQQCGRVWVILDPDAGLRARQLAGLIGPQARVVELPAKVDDAILHYGLTPQYLRQSFKLAAKAA